MVTVAVVGAGNWGKNHIRTFANLSSARLKYVYDMNGQRLAAAAKAFPSVTIIENYESVLSDAEIEGVIIASSASSHYELGKKALLAGKDVLIEKPLTLSSGDALDLVQTARKLERVLMVGHLLLYHPAVRKLKELIESGELGEIYYIYSQRLNLGTIRRDENVLWSLAPHDISVICYLLNEFPREVSVHKGRFIQKGVEDVAFMQMLFSRGRIANIHVSWLDPHKVRKITVVGSKKMVVFDDMESTEKIKIYDIGVKEIDYQNYGEWTGLRFGDIGIPRLSGGEPLRIEAEHFIECIESRRTPLSDGVGGMNVVKILEAAESGGVISKDGIGAAAEVSSGKIKEFL